MTGAGFNAVNASHARRSWRLLARDARGATAIEFAFISLPLGALMIAVLQTSLTFFAQQTLETATEKSVRQLMTGQAQQAGMTKAGFKTLVCSKLPAFMNCANLYVDVQTSTSFSSASTAPPTITYDTSGNVNNSFQYAPGGAGSINVARVMYIWHTQRGPLGFDISTLSNGDRLLIATAVVKTESYS